MCQCVLGHRLRACVAEQMLKETYYSGKRDYYSGKRSANNPPSARAQFSPGESPPAPRNPKPETLHLKPPAQRNIRDT